MRRDAFTVPSLVYLSEAVLHAGRHAQTLGETSSSLAVGSGHPSDELRRFGNEAPLRSRPAQWTASGAESGDGPPQHVGRTTGIEAGKAVPEILIVARGQGLFVRERRAADRTQQGDVV